MALKMKPQFFRIMDVNVKNISKKRKNQQGMAIIETVPMIFIFITLVGFALGFYGITQRMILSSIAARSYGFELMRNRTNINYFRDVGATGPQNSYHATQSRYFSTRERGDQSEFVAAKLPVNFTDRRPASTGAAEAHNTSAYEDLGRGGAQGKRNVKHLFNPVWIKNGYGICLSAKCGSN